MNRYTDQGDGFPPTPAAANRTLPRHAATHVEPSTAHETSPASRRTEGEMSMPAFGVRSGSKPVAVALPSGGVRIFKGANAAADAAAFRATLPRKRSKARAGAAAPAVRFAPPPPPPKKSPADLQAIATMLAARTDLPAELRAELRKLSVSQVRDVLAATPTPADKKKAEARAAQRTRMQLAAGMKVPTTTELQGTRLVFGVKKPIGGDQ